MIIKIKYLFGYKAMAIWPFIFVVGEASEKTINHEKIHHRQQIEMLLIFFYLLYLIEYIIYRIRGIGHRNAYRSISFEIEAYFYEHNLNYLKTRKFWAHLKYL